MRAGPLLLLFALGCGAAQPPPDDREDGVESDPCSDAAEELGCAEADGDGDGIADSRDACPLQPEDLDRFEDSDGCPDPDNDGDRILDVDDRCPCQPETYNGGDDEDGCPDECRVLLVDDRILILEKIYFDPNQAEIRPRASPILDAIAQVLMAHEEVRHVTLHGHASRGERNAQALSEARAQNVMAALVARGVPTERLAAVGHGRQRPVAAPGTPEAAERNRRVDFDVDEADEPPPRRSCRPLNDQHVPGCPAGDGD
ncbi:MAG: OmpA family protein [Sandaracinaceae bacterium]